jgi:hypothetical protein
MSSATADPPPHHDEDQRVRWVLGWCSRYPTTPHEVGKDPDGRITLRAQLTIAGVTEWRTVDIDRMCRFLGLFTDPATGANDLQDHLDSLRQEPPLTVVPGNNGSPK